jgi:hypothetical protein
MSAGEKLSTDERVAAMRAQAAAMAAEVGLDPDVLYHGACAASLSPAMAGADPGFDFGKALAVAAAVLATAPVPVCTCGQDRGRQFHRRDCPVAPGAALRVDPAKLRELLS